MRNDEFKLDRHSVASLWGWLEPIWLPASLAQDPHKLGKASFAWDYGLTKDEVTTAGLVAQGMTDEEIADELRLDVKSAKSRVQSLRQKLNVKNRTEAATIAMRYGVGWLARKK